MVCASKTTTFNPGGFDLERIEDGIMHQELRDSMTCGICLGKHWQFILLFQKSYRIQWSVTTAESFSAKSAFLAGRRIAPSSVLAS